MDRYHAAAVDSAQVPQAASAMALSDVRTVAIIGAGVAGLASARVLLAQGLHCTLFERAVALGGVWAGGYANFGTQVQRELYGFPDWPLPVDAPDFTPGALVQAHLEAYARHFGVWPNIRFDSTVTQVEPRDAGWQVHSLCGTQSSVEDFDLVVVCVGLYSNVPHVPDYPQQASFSGTIMHVSALTTTAPLVGKRVAVVGFGKSASDAALEAAAVATETSLIFRNTHWPVPPLLAGLLPFKWAMLNRLTSTLIPLYYQPSAVERVVHRLGSPLVWLWWRLVECLLIVQYGLGPRRGTRADLTPELPIEFDAFGETVMLPRPSFYPKLRDGTITPLPGEIARLKPDGVVLDNGTELAIDVLVLATGWKSDYSFLSAETYARFGTVDDGLYLYRQIVHPDVPGLMFIGNAASIASPLTYSLQARWLGDLLAGCHQLPDNEAMRQNIVAMQRWKRATMPFSRGRGARLLLYMQHYHDELLTDIGISPLRKRGPLAPFKEVFAPYEPADYREIVERTMTQRD